uniref:G_PROTEIN_RECEP_F1_2 domain-containing protein n=1 Tax=Heterorhabditis bacteriophora TaxID=37862 RepID=A0A1I7X3G1_HETBA
MYPFNRTESLTLMDTEKDELTDKQHSMEMANDSRLRNSKNACKTNVDSILKMSLIDDKCIAELRENQQTRIGRAWRGLNSVSRCMYHVLLLLKVLALFPGVVQSRSKGWKRTVKFILLLNFSFLAIIFNSYLLNKNMWLITAYKERFGLMHASTVSCIITGIKPMINIFILILFTLRIKEHLKLIRVRFTCEYLAFFILFI